MALARGWKVLAFPPMWSSNICCPLQFPCRGQESPCVTLWNELQSQEETIRKNSGAQAGPGPSARPWHLKRKAEYFRKIRVGRHEVAWKLPSIRPSSSALLAKQSFHLTDGETEDQLGLLPWQAESEQTKQIRPHLPWNLLLQRTWTQSDS